MIRPVTSIVVLTLAAVSPSAGQTPKTLVEWRFNSEKQWNGWTPNAQVRDAAFDTTTVGFHTVGSDPQILSPLFEVQPATNQQWVEIDLNCSGPGTGELFYTNKTTGRYGGLEPDLMAYISVPAAGPQTLTVWPFWSSQGKIIRLRFDPPSGVRCRLEAIRIMEAGEEAPEPAWTFEPPSDSWRNMHAARLNRTQHGLEATARQAPAVIITPVKPFDAARRSILRLDAACPGEHVITLYWAASTQTGLVGQPIPLDRREADGRITLDLREFPIWRGEITHLAIAFGTFGNEVLRIRSLSIGPNDPDRPFLRSRYFGFARGINRPGTPVVVRAILEHAAGPALPAGEAKLVTDDNSHCAEPLLPVPVLDHNGRTELSWTVNPMKTGTTTAHLEIDGQTFTRTLRIDPPITDRTALQRPTDGYDVPEPRPVHSDYQIGVYYFPGWSPDQKDRWQRQQEFPERDSLLGWYAEGRPEVADWHVKWAVENGISFFIYDWYWRDGKETLEAGLNQGFLKARYCDRMKFAIMWANHPPFSSHTPAQLLQVTDYWIEHYLRRPNYLTVDGKPYVSFFSPAELLSGLGSEENVRAAFDAMRERVKAAGLPGLHIGAIAPSALSVIETDKRAGFDSITSYNYIRTGAVLEHSPYRQFLIGHEAIWRTIEEANLLRYIPLLAVGWDARPWHGPTTRQYFARRTEDFAEALARLKAHLDATGGRMAILEAWNEWGEGSYLEPNVEFGFGDLEAIRTTFATPGDWPINISPDDVGLHGTYDIREPNH